MPTEKTEAERAAKWLESQDKQIFRVGWVLWTVGINANTYTDAELIAFAKSRGYVPEDQE
jgi:hypothetical protein